MIHEHYCLFPLRVRSYAVRGREVVVELVEVCVACGARRVVRVHGNIEVLEDWEVRWDGSAAGEE